eukprot:1192579-Prorocentrum_minimum.AAC.2
MPSCSAGMPITCQGLSKAAVREHIPGVGTNHRGLESIFHKYALLLRRVANHLPRIVKGY